MAAASAAHEREHPRSAAASAVTWLFVPGERPERFDKAAGAGADEVVLDLEDAVPPAGKDAAREQVCRWLASAGTGWVRVNGADTPWFEADLASLSDLAAVPSRSAPAGRTGLRGVLVPKADDADVLALVRSRVGPDRGVMALVESAHGVAGALALAASDAVDRLAFGSVDLAVDLDAVEEDRSLLLARSMLVLASRAAGKPGPVDGITGRWDDPELVRSEADLSRRLGFTGKLCIHPAQLAPAAAAFRPTDAELAWAERVLGAVGDGSLGAVAVAGQMVDKPVLDRARAITRRAR
ncbi:MAG: CoA ester lyase [Actinomycetales bacterium]|nr:CoA ester lyase [Actinomycetales bacterium]